MKKIFVIMILLSMTSCFLDSGDDSGSSGSGNAFYIIPATSGYVVRYFTLEATGTKSKVWVENSLSVSTSTSEGIASYFDNTIYPTVTNTFADHYDVDGDGKVNIVIYSGMTASSFVAGYFNPVDFYSNTESNRMDAIYLNGANQYHVPGTTNFYGTIAHEFQHMCNFSYNVIIEHNFDYTYQMPTWADEGMAEMSDALVTGFVNKQDRVGYFENPGYGYDDGDVSLILWESQVDNYALVYAFMAYLYDQDPNILSDLYTGGTANTTTEVNSIITGGLDTQYIGFLSSLYSADSTDFPGSFFPTGFSAVKSGAVGTTVYPYAFVFRDTGFSSQNGSLSYIDAGGTASPEIATWLEGTAWSDDTVSEWGELTTENTFSNASILAAGSLLSVEKGPQKIDIVFKKSDLGKVE